MASQNRNQQQRNQGAKGLLLLMLVGACCWLFRPVSHSPALASASNEAALRLAISRGPEIDRERAVEAQRVAEAQAVEQARLAATRDATPRRTDRGEVGRVIKSCLAGESESALSRAHQFVIANDDIGLNQLRRAGLVRDLPPGTKCRVITPGFLTAEVRVLDGPFANELLVLSADLVMTGGQ